MLPLTGIGKPPEPAMVHWNDLVKGLWNALAIAPMSHYYQATDWAFARLLCEQLHDAMTSINGNTGQKSASAIGQCMTELSRLGVTEADRRRLRFEVEVSDIAEEKDAAVVDMESMRQRLRGA